MIINCIIFAMIGAGMVWNIYSEMTEHQSSLNNQKWLAKKIKTYR